MVAGMNGETQMDDFTEWCGKVRSAIAAKMGPGGDAICGTNEDLRGYFEDGYSPECTAGELISYAAEDHVDDAA